MPGALQHVCLPKHVTSISSSYSSTSGGNRENEKGGFEARITLEIDDEVNNMGNVSTVLFDRAGKHLELGIPAPAMFEAAEEEIDSGQDTSEKDVDPDSNESSPMVENTEMKNMDTSDNFQPTSKDQKLPARSEVESMDEAKSTDNDGHAVGFKSDNSFHDPKDSYFTSQAISQDSKHVNHCRNLQVSSVTSVPNGSVSLVMIKHKETASVPHIVLREIGYHNAISYI